MRPIIQLRKKLLEIIKCLLLYFSISMLCIVTFGYIYFRIGQSDPLQLSFEIFWGIGGEIPNAIRVCAYGEHISYEIFSVVIVGIILAKLLEKPNPIHFAKYLVYDTVTRKISFRYWIMLPQGSYLYNVKIRVLVTDYYNHQCGVNKLKDIWTSEIDNPTLDQVRGIRFAVMNEKFSKSLIKEFEEAQKKHRKSGLSDRCTVDISIIGTSDKGVTYHGWYKYYHILKGYRHVPLQRHEYESDSFYSKKKLTDMDLMKMEQSYKESGKTEFFRYQHFDKIYLIDEQMKIQNGEYSKCIQEEDILSRHDIIDGQYCGTIKQFCIDAVSLIIRFFLDSDKKITTERLRKYASLFLQRRK